MKMYFRADMKRLTGNRIIQILFLAMLAVFILDPVLARINTIRYPWAYDGVNPFNYFGLVSGGLAGSLFCRLCQIFPVFLTGMLYYEDSRSSMREFLVVRRGKWRYLCSKTVSVLLFSFLFFAVLFLIHFALVYCLFPMQDPVLDYYIPQAGTWAAVLFGKSPLLMLWFYIGCSVLMVSIYTVFVQAMQMCIRFPNRYVAMLVPVVSLFAINFLLESSEASTFFSLVFISQPAVACSYAAPVTARGFAAAFGCWVALDAVLTGIGFLRGRDVAC